MGNRKYWILGVLWLGMLMVISWEVRAQEKNYTETVNGVTFEMVYVEGGIFMMGALENEGKGDLYSAQPAHQVKLSDYYIGKYEVTQGLWKAVMGNNPSVYQRGDNYPVDRVSWEDAREFCDKLSRLTGRKYALPTEAQWEYAARGGVESEGYVYSGSNVISDVSWCGNLNSGTYPVGSKQPNELGIYDMSGNVREWCRDWYGAYPAADSVVYTYCSNLGIFCASNLQTDPTGPVTGTERVIRGGCWFDGAARCCSVSFRYAFVPDMRSDVHGFRVVRVP